MKLNLLFLCSQILISSIAMTQDLSAIDSLFTKYQGENTPGASVMVIREGEIILRKNYGYADLESGIKVESSTNFRLASVSKQFTATCILQLVSIGRLSLDNNLTEIFPGFPDYGKTITVKHLLNHSSGIEDYEDHVSDTAFNPQIKDKGVLEIVSKLSNGYFEPGTRYRYSNTAYALLALTVEKYSGKSFGEYLSEKIFRPLKMDESIAYEKGLNEVKQRAYGYSISDGKWVRKDQSSTSAVLGDGGIYSSAEDLYKWDQALHQGKVLPLALVQESMEYNRFNDGSAYPYGYGWHLKKWNDHQVVYHTGSSTSFRNIFYRIPALKLSIIILTNRNRPEEEDMVPLAESVLPLVIKQ